LILYLDTSAWVKLYVHEPGSKELRDDLNAALPRVIIAPLSSKGQPLGCRPKVKFAGKSACILLDQLRSVDKRRLAGKMGEIDLAVWHPVLLEMLA